MVKEECVTVCYNFYDNLANVCDHFFPIGNLLSKTGIIFVSLNLKKRFQYILKKSSCACCYFYHTVKQNGTRLAQFILYVIAVHTFCFLYSYLLDLLVLSIPDRQ